jgi:hypothetical protein
LEGGVRSCPFTGRAYLTVFDKFPYRFAAAGDPNGGGAVVWLQYDASTDRILQIDDSQVAINGYNNTQCDYFSMFQMP